MGTNAIGKVSTMFIPEELQRLPRWNKWQSVPNRDDPTKKPKKIPFQVNGGVAGSTDNAVDQWTTFQAAYQSHQETGARGIGFLLIKADPFTGIDLDRIIDPETGEISERGKRIISMFPGAYKEISPSETGVKLWIKGKKPAWCTKCTKDFDSGERVEVYDHSKFFTVTGRTCGEPVGEIADHEAEVARLCEELFSTEVEDPRRGEPEVEELGLDVRGHVSLLLSFRNAESFRRLYEDGALSDHDDDHSSADVALCTHLAFVTRDVDAIDKIFRSSALYREKWERESYRMATIMKALEYQDDFYDPSLSFLKPRIRRMYMDVLRMRWDDFRDPLIMMAHLEMAHKSCNYRGENVIWDAAHRDIRMRTNIHSADISRRINSVLKSEYPLSRPFLGAHGKRSRYMIAPAGDDIPRTYTHEIGEEQIRVIRRVRFRASYCHLSYPSQWALIQIVAHRKIPTESLKDIMGYTGATKSLRKRVLKPLKDKKLIREKGGILYPSGNTRKKVTRLFDEDKFQRVVMEVMEERTAEHIRNRQG
jgi:hypothetical protein